jgi:hypothetical protein
MGQVSQLKVLSGAGGSRTHVQNKETVRLLHA